MKNKNLTVLYAEDETNVREHYSILLKYYFNEIYEAKDGHEALDIFYDKKPDFLILDIEMPKVNGLEVIKRIREKDSQIKIIILAGPPDTKRLMKAVSLNIFEYLVKPVSRDIFKKTIEKALNEINTYSRKIILQNDTNILEYDEDSLLLFNNKQHIKLTKYEITLFDYLHKHKNKVLTKDEIAYNVWERFNKTTSDHGIRNLVKNLNKKLPQRIITNVYGDGYRLETSQKQTIDKAKKDSTQDKEKYSLHKHIIDGKEALLILDINNLNIVNKLHGYLFGNIFLEDIEKLLRKISPEYVDIHRITNGRFGLLMPNYHVSYLECFSKMIISFFENHEIQIDEKEYLVGFNIGIARITPERDAMVDAEYALSCSKRHGKSVFIFCEEDFENFNAEIKTIENFNKIRDYISEEMIIPWLQPIIDTKDDSIYKYESLARIVDEDEIYTPIQFLTTVKKLGLSASLTKIMINKTFKLFSNSDIKFSINITEEDILGDYLVDFVRYKLKYFNISPSQVTFEVLENITLNTHLNEVNHTIKGIQNLGCTIAIDDFGSDNSNFGRIISFKSDYIKIDRIFVQDCDIDESKRFVISAIVQLAKHLNIKTVAEFIDRETIYTTIKKLGVDYAQGYFLGRPSPLFKHITNKHD